MIEREGIELLGPEPGSHPTRVVSLCPSITESLFDLGVGDRVIGVTRYCVHPEEVRWGRVVVGGTKDPDLEKIRSLRPDLLVVNREENRRDDVLALAKTAPVEVSHPTGPAEIPGLLRWWGSRFRVESTAEDWALRVEAGLLGLHPVPFRFVCLVWREPWIAVGSGTYVEGLLRSVGGQNGVVGHGYPVLTLAELVVLNVDLLILPSEPFPFRAAHGEEIAAAGFRGQWLVVDGEDLCWHGTRTVRGLQLARDLTDKIAG